ncbi:recombinase family protein [Vagococcus sp. JNUCC 83]
MTVFGYVRKGYPEETISQFTLLMTCGCDTLFIEQTGLASNAELDRLLDQLVKGDTVMVVSLLSLGKGLSELAEIIQRITVKEAELRSIHDNINTTDRYLFQDILSAINRLHSQITSDKIKRKLDELKVSGQQLGRPTVDQETIDRIIQLRKEYATLREISEICGVSISTVHKYVNQMTID